MVNTSFVNQMPREQNEEALKILESGVVEMGVVEFKNGSFALVSMNALTEQIAPGAVRKLETHERDQLLAALRENVGVGSKPVTEEAPATVDDDAVEASVRRALAKIFGTS